MGFLDIMRLLKIDFKDRMRKHNYGSMVRKEELLKVTRRGESYGLTFSDFETDVTPVCHDLLVKLTWRDSVCSGSPGAMDIPMVLTGGGGYAGMVSM